MCLRWPKVWLRKAWGRPGVGLGWAWIRREVGLGETLGGVEGGPEKG